MKTEKEIRKRMQRLSMWKGTPTSAGKWYRCLQWVVGDVN